MISRFLFHALMVICAFAISATIIGWLFTRTDSYNKGFQDGYEARREFEKTEKGRDAVCAAWMFESNFKEAKARICKGR